MVARSRPKQAVLVGHLEEDPQGEDWSVEMDR